MIVVTICRQDDICKYKTKTKTNLCHGVLCVINATISDPWSPGSRIDELDHLASLLTPAQSTSTHSRITRKRKLSCITINNTSIRKKSSQKKLSRGIDELDLLTSLLTPTQSTSTHSRMARKHKLSCHKNTFKRKKENFLSISELVDCPAAFLAVQDSSKGDIVSQSVSQ